MSTFYFDYLDGGEAFVDEIGQEMEDAAAARAVAAAMLLELAAPLPDGQDRHEVAVTVRDARGAVVLTTRLCRTVEWT